MVSLKLPRPNFLIRRRPSLSLALQGGGAHGAFTWGVLDRLLEEEEIDIAAISGTSAGAMNASVLAAGWLQNGRQGARASLSRLWQTVGWEAEHATLPTGGLGALAVSLALHMFSPYELNPLAINPLRDILEQIVDFAALREKSPMPLLIAATQVETGECRIFREHELTVEMVLASSCLPQIHHAIEVDGVHYWDGGFSSNPPVLALAELERSSTLLVLRINPLEAGGLPQTAGQIRNRTAEIMFGRPLAAELAQLDQLQRFARAPLRWLQPKLRHIAALDLQIIDGDDTLIELDPVTRVMPSTRLLVSLRDAGRAAGEAWLTKWRSG